MAVIEFPKFNDLERAAMTVDHARDAVLAVRALSPEILEQITERGEVIRFDPLDSLRFMRDVLAAVIHDQEYHRRKVAMDRLITESLTLVGRLPG